MQQDNQPHPLYALIFLLCFGAALVALLLLFTSSSAPSVVSKLRNHNTLTVGLLTQRTHKQAPEPPPSVHIIDQTAQSFGWEVLYQSYDNLSAMTEALANKEVDMLADLVIDHRPGGTVLFSSVYDTGRPILVYFPQLTSKPSSLAKIEPNSLLVINNSWQEHYLNQQKLNNPLLRWQEVPDFFTLQELVESIGVEPGGYSVILDRELTLLALENIGLASFTNLIPVSLGFGFRREDTGLATLFNQSIERWKNSKGGKPFSRLLPRISRVDLTYLLKRMETRLPKYIDLMVEAGQTYGLDWRLIAAIAYQESLWSKDAVSPTGVRGLMMLTRATASSLGLSNRADPKQSIFGGTRYFLFLRDQIPTRIPEPDRSWFALAAYNVGFAHVEAIRVYTQGQGGNPDKWKDVSSNLPLLEDPSWYKNSKHGFARGREAQTYVANIRKYFSVFLYLLPLDQPIDTKEATPRLQMIRAATTPALPVLPERISTRF